MFIYIDLSGVDCVVGVHRWHLCGTRIYFKCYGERASRRSQKKWRKKFIHLRFDDVKVITIVALANDDFVDRYLSLEHCV